MFVDDEPHLLSGLRRGLRAKRKDWELIFATGGEQALAMLAEQPVDIVISDMRMPGMDGAELLAEVRRRYPATARVVLSGHADRAAIITAIGPTQQYLAKPCEADAVVGTVERVLSVRELIRDPATCDLLGGLEALPKPPSVYEEMMALVADENCRFGDVIEVIERDLATSAEVLKLVNSAFFGLPVQVESVARAVSLLGLETIQGLAVAGAVFGRGGHPLPGIDPSRLCREGVHVGMLAKRFAVADGWPAQGVNDVFFAGLLHRVALPVLAAAHPDGWGRLRGREIRDPYTAAEEETAAFGRTVTLATGYLLGLWGFSESVVEAIADQPVRVGDPSATPAALVLTLARGEQLTPGAPLDPPEQSGPDAFLTAERAQLWEKTRGEVHDNPDEREEPSGVGVGAGAADG